MRRTDDLIAELTSQARPVERLGHPLWRSLQWLLAAGVMVALVGSLTGMRADLANKFTSLSFCTCLGAALVTAALAAFGSLMAGQPDRSRWWLALPLPSLAVWGTDLGYSCLTNWIDLGTGMGAWEILRCLATVLLISLPLSAGLLVQLRHAARLRPAWVTLCAGLAVGAVAGAAMFLLHKLDASSMVLVWTLGVAGAVALAEWLVGRVALGWLDQAMAR